MLTGYLKVNLYNRALGLVGDYNLSATGGVETSSLFISVDSAFRTALYTIFTDLRSASNYATNPLTGASLLGNYYQYTIPSATKLLRPHLIVNTKDKTTYSFTDLFTRETGDGIFIKDNTSLIIHKDYIPTVATLDNINFCFFYQPNLDGVFASTNIIMEETVVECLCLKVASMLAVFLGNDINLSQLLDNQFREILAVVKSNQGLDYGRPFKASISAPSRWRGL
jgi:hypothetical protein